MGANLILLNAPGPQGPAGPKGPKGDIGLTGPQGPAITPGTSGQFFITNGSTATWTSLVTVEPLHGQTTVGGGGTDFKAVIGPWVGNPAGFSCVWFLAAATAPAATNFSILGDGTHTYINAPSGNILLRNTNQDNIAQFTTGGLVMESNAIQWIATTTPAINQLAPGSDVAPANLTIAAQAPFASATVHTTAGDVIVNTPASVGSGAKYGGFQVQYNSTAAVLMGGYNNNATYSAIWFKTAAASPSSNNFAFLSDGASYTALNSPGGNLFLAVGNINFFMMSNSALSVSLPTTLGTTTGINTLTGGLQSTVRSTSTNLTVDTTTTDNIIVVDTTSGAVTVTLPAPTAGRWFILIDKTNNFAVNNCTLIRHGTEKIDGVAASKVISSSDYRGFIWSDGTDWYTK